MEHINPSTDQLLKACLKNDQVAQCAIYDRYYKAMYNTAFRIVKNTAEAEDIMQDSFLKAFTRIETYNAEASFGSWLKRIVINDSLSAYKKQKRRAEEPLEQQLYKIEDKHTESVHNEQKKQLKQVLKTMNTLKENYRICLTLHLIEGYDYHEVSSMLDISYANCRTMISRAKESLRKKLSQTYKT